MRRQCALSIAVIVGLVLLVLPGLTPATARGRTYQPAQTQSWEPGLPRYGVGVETDVPVTMSDGVVLRADVVYPTDPATGERAPGRFPVLLEQTPYHWHRINTDPGQYSDSFVSRGYIYVLAQVRGTWQSGGEFCFLCDREKQDGVELVDWAAHQLPGSNGTLGLHGCSYAGINQYFTAARLGRNSPVKAIAPSGMGAYFYREPFFMGGAPTGVGEIFFSPVLGAIMGSDSVTRYAEEASADIKTGGERAYDREYWQERMAGNAVEDVVRNQIPALVWSGWDDYYPIGASEVYAMFQNAHHGRDVWAPMRPNQPTTGRYQLVMGTGGHCAGAGEAPTFEGPRLQDELRWYDTWVRGVDTGMAETATPMRLHELGTDRWVSHSSYPMTSDYRTYYLNPGGDLTGAKPGAMAGSDRIRYAPPTDDGASLTYTTQPFEETTTLAGPIAMTVYASSTTTNLELIAKVFDVAPDGTVTKLSMGAVTGSLRALIPERTWHDTAGHPTRPYQALTNDDHLVPGTVTRFDIQLQPTLTALKPGHRLQLTLETQTEATACASYPYPCVNPTLPQQRTLLGGVYDIQHNETWASHVSLPLLPYDCLGGAGRPVSPTTSQAAPEQQGWETQYRC